MEYGGAGVVALIGAIAAGAGAILSLLGKWILDYFQKRSDVTIAELKTKVESQKTDREIAFAEAIRLIHIAQERENASEKERASMRDEMTLLRHQLDECKSKLKGRQSVQRPVN